MTADKGADREVLLQNFGHALAALMGSALSDLPPEKARLLVGALENGTGTIQVLVHTDLSLLKTSYPAGTLAFPLNAG